MLRLRLKFSLDQGDPEQTLIDRNNVILSVIRQASYIWPPRQRAIIRATPERGKRKCAKCKMHVHYSKAQVDHIDPVIPLDGSFDPKNPDWKSYIDRVFVPLESWQVLCKPCHVIKSSAENNLRAENKEILQLSAKKDKIKE